MFAYKYNRCTLFKNTFKKTAFFFRINIQFQVEDIEAINKLANTGMFMVTL